MTAVSPLMDADIPWDAAGESAEQPPRGIPSEYLEDGAFVASEGRTIDAQGIPYVLDGVIPAYGMLGFLVAYAKVGKTTFGLQLAAHVGAGRPFLDRATAKVRVLIVAAEDPREYTAWLARHMRPMSGDLTFVRRPVLLNLDGLQQIRETVQSQEFGLVLISSWQAVIRGLIKDENDNAGAVRVVEDVKAAARRTGIPWLIDAHSGKGEDQGEDADPLHAMRGASAAAGAADYMLSLRYANGTFGNQRRLSGKGRFVSFAPLTLDFDPDTSGYTVAEADKDATAETDWRLICDTGVLPSGEANAISVTDLARAAGIVKPGVSLGGNVRKRLYALLRSRPGVLSRQTDRRGQKVDLFYRVETP